jgi:hypothetical protein
MRIYSKQLNLLSAILYFLPPILSLSQRSQRYSRSRIERIQCIMRALALFLIFTAAFTFPAIDAADKVTMVFIDPIKGSPNGDGSSMRPWRTLEEVINVGLLEQLPSGTILKLRDGYHGHVKVSGDNLQPLTIEADEGARPQLARFEIEKGSGWIIRGLVVSPTFAEEGEPHYNGKILTVGERGPTENVTVEDCFVHDGLDAKNWGAKKWMSLHSGMCQGRYGTNLTFRNNFVLNTRFGIELASTDSLCQGNVISDFSGDGIRVMRDGITVEHNVIRNVYVGSGDGDQNHDDAIQCFLFNKGTGTVRNITLRANLIVNWSDDQQPLKATCQAIGFFDGPLVDFLVENNVCLVSHYHGVSLYDAQGCKVLNNAVMTRWGGRLRPWIMLGQKKNQAINNQVHGNLAHSFNFKADPTAQVSKNKMVTKRAFYARYEKLTQQIVDTYGKQHAAAARDRF